ncbi:hypothetical protein SteCoe_7931 [Stentor coeruleus]|uniref:Uncharacterized protein n=1 Tax=Stentor coeruleus TaxID=5963 RepID=A0A1R2CLF3_9CILI|nr:hypothetical protein SteCoe_7931 [Stentor coeruleus]
MKETAPLWTMRGRNKYVHTEKVPGPGTYSPTDSMMMTSPKYRLGTAPRKDLAELLLTPGPGTYSPSKYPDTPSWTITSKAPRLNLSHSPGTYRINLSQGSPRYSVGRGIRKSIENPQFAPGPGAYNPQLQAFKGNNLFPKAERVGITTKTIVPGPGVYEIKSKGVEGPSYSFRPKLRVKEVYPVPGPGNYNPNSSTVKEKSPSWGLGKSEKIDGTSKDRSFPGPGTYLAFSTLAGPKWGFGSSKRGWLVEGASPGPGTYEVKSSIGATPTYVTISK